MNQISVSFDGRVGTLLTPATITSGSVGMTESASFSSDWLSYETIFTFRGSGRQVDVATPTTLSTMITKIPYEVLTEPGGHLMVGAYGTNGQGTIAVPTVWIDVGIIEEGAAPSGVSPTPTTPSLVDQLLGGNVLPVANGGTGVTSIDALRALVNFDVVPISQGGTGAIERADAMANLAFLGSNPITSPANDTREAWQALGTGYAYFNVSGQLNDQPTQYGILLNIAYGTSQIVQLWMSMTSSASYRRSGNANGWADTWRRLLDNASPVAVANGGTGVTTVDGIRNLVGVNDIDIVSQGTAIPSGADLNTYTTTGKYYSAQQSVTSTISNKPVEIIYGFSLYVLTQGQNGKLQLIVQNWSTYPSRMFYRIYGGSWGPWQEMGQAAVDYQQFAYVDLGWPGNSTFFASGVITYLGNSRYRVQIGGNLLTDPTRVNVYTAFSAAAIRDQINALFGTSYTTIYGFRGTWQSDPGMTVGNKGYGQILSPYEGGGSFTSGGFARVWNAQGAVGSWGMDTLYVSGGRYMDIDMIIRFS